MKIPFLIKHNVMNTYGGGGGIDPQILNLGTGQRQVVSFMPQPLYPQGKGLGTHWTGDWAGPSVSVDAVVKS
jgi:hypothetical protein